MKCLPMVLIACLPAGLWGQPQGVPDSSAPAGPAALADTAAQSFASPAVISVGSLLISADAESVRVVVDGIARGYAPLRVDSLAPGPHSVLLLPADPASWLTAAEADTVFIAAGTETARRYPMHRWYSISSIPAGEPVSTDDSLAGVTPLLIPSDRVTRGTRIAIGGGNFRPATVTLDDFVRGTLLVRLEPTSPGDMAEMLASRDLLPEPPSSTGLIVSGVASVAFGVAAAYFKGSADRAADQFLDTRDPALIQKRDRMDSSAALAVVGLQVSLGFFMYFLLSR